MLWLTSTSDPIFDVVKLMCSSPMTISSSCKMTQKSSSNLQYTFSKLLCKAQYWCSRHFRVHLSSNSVWRWPQSVVFLHNFRIGYNSFQFLQYTFVSISLKNTRRTQTFALTQFPTHTISLPKRLFHNLIIYTAIILQTKTPHY